MGRACFSLGDYVLTPWDFSGSCVNGGGRGLGVFLLRFLRQLGDGRPGGEGIVRSLASFYGCCSFAGKFVCRASKFHCFLLGRAVKGRNKAVGPHFSVKRLGGRRISTVGTQSGPFCKGEGTSTS